MLCCLHKLKLDIPIDRRTVLGTSRVATVSTIHFALEECLQYLESGMAPAPDFVYRTTDVMWHCPHWSSFQKCRFDQKSPGSY